MEQQQRTRALVDSSPDLVVNLLPLAPGLFPVFGHAIGSILANAGLLTGAPPLGGRTHKR